jgi:hypothetical protein
MMEELVPLFVIVWWMALTPVAAFYLLRYVLVDDPQPPGSGLTTEELAELEADPRWQEHQEYRRQRQDRWQNAPAIVHVGLHVLLMSLRRLWLAVKIVFLPCVIAYWIAKAADKWWRPLPIAIAIRRFANTKLKWLI